MNLQKHMTALLGKKLGNDGDDVSDLVIDDTAFKMPPLAHSDDDIVPLELTITDIETPSPSTDELRTGDILEQALLDDQDTCFVVIDPDGQIISPHASVSSLIAGDDNPADIKSFADLIGLYCRNIDTQGSNPTKVENSLLRRAAEHKQQPRRANSSWTTPTKDGRILHLRTKYTPSGHLVLFVNDVTEKEQERHMLRLGMRIGTSGYWTFDYETGAVDCSDYIRDALNDDEIERTRKNGLLALVHPDDIDNAAMAFLQARSENTRMDGVFRIVTAKKGDLWVNIVGEFYSYDSSGQKGRFVAYINDVTKDMVHRKEIEDAQALSHAKTEFFARMSHEIKTPLNAIVGMTDALMGEVHNEEAKETARYIADAAQNLDSVLSQTMEHARLSSKELVLDVMDTDMRDLVRSTCALFKKASHDKGLSLSIRVTDTVPSSIKTDPTRLRQCLTNLLSNAVKFTDTGRIDVALAALNTDGPSPQLVLAVKDSGIGMSAKQAKNIFKPFAQADETIRRRFGGAGLGMAITRQITEAMGGNIRVKSQEGQGTTVIISVPLMLNEKALTSPSALQAAVKAERVTMPSPTAAATPSPIAAEPADMTGMIAPTLASAQNTLQPSPSSSPVIKQNVEIKPSNYSGFDILVVEDNPINQKVVGKLLTGYVRSITFAFNGEEALNVLERQSFDVVLMDIHMPVKDGIETTLEIRNSGKPYANIVIVALTADPDYQQKRICRNIGMNDTIGKPVRRKDLLDAMERVLGIRSQNTENAA